MLMDSTTMASPGGTATGRRERGKAPFFFFSIQAVIGSSLLLLLLLPHLAQLPVHSGIEISQW